MYEEEIRRMGLRSRLLCGTKGPFTMADFWYNGRGIIRRAILRGWQALLRRFSTKRYVVDIPLELSLYCMSYGASILWESCVLCCRL